MNDHDYRIFRLFTNPAWMATAPCKTSDADFYGPSGNTGGSHQWATKAKAVCNGCPHRIPCLEYAIDNNEDHGIWGGLSVRERRSIARNRRAMGWSTGRHRNITREAS